MAKKGVRFKELMGRLTGISTSIFGVSWDPSKPEVAVAREVLTFLEDRRVLFSPTEMETPEHCVTSVIEIRRVLTQKITEAAERSVLSEHLRALRAACHKFLSTVEADDGRVVRFGFERGNYQSWVFLGALGEMRGVFGVHIAAVAAMHGLDVEEGLAAILPARADS